MDKYLDFLEYVLKEGKQRKDRTGVGTLSVFGEQLKFDLRETFPLITTKKMNWNVVVTELAWFLLGETNVKWLNDRNIHIWDAWADENGELGPIYSKQWRNFGGIDQLTKTVDNLRENPFSRRHVISFWNPPELDKMALEPCHFAHQFYVTNDWELDIHVNLRSNDIAIGMPYNIAEYALLTHLIAFWAGNLTPGTMTYSIGDAHLYLNHLAGVEEQLSRKPYPLPTIELKLNRIEMPTPENIVLHNYKHHPFIKFEVAV